MIRIFLGVSPAMRNVAEQVRLVAPTEYSVIIQGESGVGKEMVARAIHGNSLRKSGPFVSIDCGALSRELSSSEFFGHRQGAFTGAVQNKSGLMELSNGGTLFLDEIGNLPYDIQVTLLRSIQEKLIRPVGGTSDIPIDVRFIVATNDDLLRKVEEGNFRKDLYFRLNEFSVVVPPLRERKEDIRQLATGFLDEVCRELEKPLVKLSPSMMEALEKYHWPGNIRELKNTVRRLALVADTGEIGGYIPGNPVVEHRRNQNPDSGAVAQEENRWEKIGNGLKSAGFLAEYKFILETLKQVNFNKSKAASLLNISRRTLYNKLEQFEKHLMYS